MVSWRFEAPLFARLLPAVRERQAARGGLKMEARHERERARHQCGKNNDQLHRSATKQHKNNRKKRHETIKSTLKRRSERSQGVVYPRRVAEKEAREAD